MTEWTPEQISWLEKKFAKLLGEAKLKGFSPNYKVVANDERTYYIDFANPMLKLGFEVDSAAYHSTKSQIKRDLARQAILEDTGWTIERFSGEEILKSPSLVKKRAKQAVGKAAQKALSEGFPLG